MWQIEVDKDKCTGDEERVNACPGQVFELVDGKADPVNSDECLGCETCVEVCPKAPSPLKRFNPVFCRIT